MARIPTARIVLLVLPIPLLLASWWVTFLLYTGTRIWPIDGYQLFVLLLVPGWYETLWLYWKAKIGVTEAIALDFALSLALVMSLTVFISFLPGPISRWGLTFALLVVTSIPCLLLIRGLKQSPMHFAKPPRVVLLATVAELAIAFSIGFCMESRVLPPAFWRGGDPWLNTPLASAIVTSGLDPTQLTAQFPNFNIAISGFFYELAAIHSFSGISLYTISRYGGPFFGGLVAVLSFCIFRRYGGTIPAFLAIFLLYLNPFFNLRFAMTIRENLAFVFLLGMILLLDTLGDEKDTNYSHKITLGAIGLLAGASLSVHPLEFSILFGMVLLYVLSTLRKHLGFRSWVLPLALAMFVAFPYLLYYSDTVSWVLLHWFSFGSSSLALPATVCLVGAIVAVALAMRTGFFRYSGPSFLTSNLTCLWYGLGCIMLTGAMYSVAFPRAFPILGVYNPPITLDMFASTSLLLGGLGLSVAATPRFNRPKWLVPLLAVCIAPIDLPVVGVAFPLFRIVIYLSWILSFGVILLTRGLRERFSL